MRGRKLLLWLLAVLVSLLMGCGCEEKADVAVTRGGKSSVSTAQMVAEPLPNGVVLDDELSVALVGFDRGPQVTKVRLAFRRVGEQRRLKGIELVLSDDRGNTYGTGPSSYPSREREGPANPETLPCGFTWVASAEVRMPQIAPIVRAVLETAVPTGRTLGSGETGKHGSITVEDRSGGSLMLRTSEEVRRLSAALPLTNLRPPPLDFTIRPEHLVHAGKEMKLDKDLTLVFGDVEVKSAAMAQKASTPERRLCLVIPVVVRNDDYSPHPAPVGPVHVQLEDGSICRESSLANAPVVPPQGKVAFDIGSSLDLRLMPRILLVYKADHSFIGFAKISESNLEQIKKLRSAALTPEQAMPK